MEKTRNCEFMEVGEVEAFDFNAKDLCKRLFSEIHQLPEEMQQKFRYKMAFQEQSVVLNGEGTRVVETRPAKVQIEIVPLKEKD